VQEFLSWVEKNYAYSVLGPYDVDEEKPFVPLEKIQRYFSIGPGIASSNQRLDALLIDLFYPNIPPVDSDAIRQNYLLVLCVLLSCGKGRHIKDFVESKISDDALPLKQTELYDRLSTAVFAQLPLCEDFYAKQWQFCVPFFETSYLQNRTFADKQLLPIVRQEKLGISTIDPNLHVSKFQIYLYSFYNEFIDEEDQAVRYFILSFVVLNNVSSNPNLCRA
jgi:hypothetical protein